MAKTLIQFNHAYGVDPVFIDPDHVVALVPVEAKEGREPQCFVHCSGYSIPVKGFVLDVARALRFDTIHFNTPEGLSRPVDNGSQK